MTQLPAEPVRCIGDQSLDQSIQNLLLSQENRRLRAALAMAYDRWMISCHPDNDFPDWPDDAASVMNDLWKEGWPEQARAALENAKQEAA